MGVTAADVSHQLRRVQQEVPGGRGDIGGAEQSVRTIATVQTVAGLAALDVPLVDGRRIRLDQVATVTDTIAERRAIAGYYQGPTSVSNGPLYPSTELYIENVLVHRQFFTSN